MDICEEINIYRNLLLFLSALLRYFYSTYFFNHRPLQKLFEGKQISLLVILNWLLTYCTKYLSIFKMIIYKSLLPSTKSTIGGFIRRVLSWLIQWQSRKALSKIMSSFQDWIGTNIQKKCIRQSLWLKKERSLKSWLIVYIQILSKCMKNCVENIFDLLFFSNKLFLQKQELNPSFTNLTF